MFKKFTLSLLTAVLVAGSYIGVATSQSSSSQPAPGLMPRGTAALPGMYFAGDRDTGIYWSAADALGISVAGASRVTVSISDFTFNASASADRRLTNQNNSAGTAAEAVIRVLNTDGALKMVALGTGFTTSGASVQDGGLLEASSALSGGLSIVASNATTGDIRFYSGGNASGNERARIANDGTVLIGTTTDSAAALDVNGVLRHNGTQAYWLKQVTTLTSGSGTYTVPSGVRALKVQLVGGGGGGGYARAQTTANAQAVAGGGQSGYCAEAWMTGLAASYSYGVGAAGAGGVAATVTNATLGGDTTFATFTAKGGGAGNSVTVTTAVLTIQRTVSNGAKSANAGATLNSFGGLAAASGMVALGNLYTTQGGRSCVSGPSDTSQVTGSNSAAAGSAGDTYGGGGGGAVAWRNASNIEADGGAGAAGVIVIEEYF